MSQQNVELLKKGYQDFAKQDIPAVLNILDPQIEWYEPDVPGLPFRGRHHGPQAVADEVFATIPRDWDEFFVEPDEFLDSGDTVVALGRFRGRAKATQKELNAPFAHVWKVRAGKVIRGQDYTDTAAFLKVLGVEEPAARR